MRLLGVVSEHLRKLSCTFEVASREASSLDPEGKPIVTFRSFRTAQQFRANDECHHVEAAHPLDCRGRYDHCYKTGIGGGKQ